MTKSFKKVAAAMLFSLVSFAVQSQTIGGAVFGGGRMGDVSGSTLVTVVKCDTVSAVFGGNDIAGTVTGTTANDSSFNGAQVVIGKDGRTTTKTSVGSVYGGGNGYYYYPTVGTSVTTSALTAGTVHNYDYDDTDAQAVGNVDIADIAAGLLVPQTPKTRVSMHTANAYVDSIFGGAKNAFITTTGTDGNVNSTEVNIYGGTAYSVFGGNNYGGTLGAGSAHAINVFATTTGTSANLGGDQNGHAFGGHGIRYLFGGGNKVTGQYVYINVTGGQIDTLFAGGNSADVAATTVNVNVTTPLYTLATSPYTDPVNNAYSPVTSVFDIRCLFGGNNAADMSGLPTLNLTKGGIHNVYGGGNKGVMNANASWAADGNIIAGTSASTKVLLNSSNIIVDTVYGGGQSAGTLHDTYVIMTDGHVGTIFGGTNITGTIPVGAKSNVDIVGGDLYMAAYGGSNGFYRCVDEDEYLSGASNGAFANNAYSNITGFSPVIYETNVHIGGTANIHRNVYGGGNMAHVGSPTSAANAGHTNVLINGTPTFSNSTDKNAGIFGGGNFANIFGTARTTIDDSPEIYGNVYGGNDKTGTVTGVLSGGSYTAANEYTTSARTDAQDLTSFLGYNMNASTTTKTVKAPAVVTILGTPQIHGSVFGGGNGDYNYYHYNGSGELENYTSNASLPWVMGRDVVLKCDMPPIPNQNGSVVDINMDQTGHIDYAFAGGNAASVGVTVTVGSYTYPANPTAENGLKPYLWFNCNIANATIEADASSGNNINVGTIFGGNNKAAMSAVPRLYFFKGKAGYVYGGGNLGDMTATNENFGQLAFNVGTYVGMPSQYFVVNNNVYGGCNVADVTKDSYVLIKRGTVLGDIFGGNDLAGEVNASHVEVDGDNLTVNGNLYGGGNGDYPMYKVERETSGEHTGEYYYLKSDNVTKVYAPANVYPTQASTPTTPVYCKKNFELFDLKGRPYVGVANVEIKGEVTFLSNVYGGGISGDCRETHVLLDAADGVFEGMVFGAGRGRVDNMGFNVRGCHNPYIGVAHIDGENNVTYGEDYAMGNVLETAYLTVRNFASMNPVNSAIYGGGQAGNVVNTVVNYEATAQNRLHSLYIGSLAADVTGTATGIIDAYEPANGEVIIDTIYGGNDFAGRVQHTDLTINSGIFTHVFGAGNGDYMYYEWVRGSEPVAVGDLTPAQLDAYAASIGKTADELTDEDKQNCAIQLSMASRISYPRIGTSKLDKENWEKLSQPCGSNTFDTVPYSMQIDITVNGGIFNNTVYGGGNMGLVGNRDLDPTAVEPQLDWNHDIGSIVMTIHGGHFQRHVFAGARGITDMRGWYFTRGANDKVNADSYRVGKQLVYGTKVVNMDGGVIDFSLYGGSEAVDDGFPYECGGMVFNNNKWYTSAEKYAYYSQNTTLRPSSVLNITGGEIKKSLYGGGYQGNIYGSVYVNIGVDAVRDSKAWEWSHTYSGVSGSPTVTIEPLRPNIEGYSTKRYTRSLSGTSVVESLTDVSVPTYPDHATIVCSSNNHINLGASVYNGSDWGEAGDQAYFNTRGVYGGETNILIDGKQYNTTKHDETQIGRPNMYIANSIIGAGTSTEGGDVHRVITMRHFGDYYCPEPSMELFSIQRADKVVLDSVFLNLKGDQDAFMAYQSPNYSFCRIDTLIFQIDNIVTTFSPSLYIGHLASMKTNDNSRDIYDANRLYNNKEVTDAVENMANDLFDNIFAPSGCTSTNNPCATVIDICTKLPTLRGTSGLIGAFNVLMFKNGSYMKISPFIDKHYDIELNEYDENQVLIATHHIGDEGADGHDDAFHTGHAGTGHPYGHVEGYMYIVAEDNTMSYVYADYKFDGADGTPSGVTEEHNLTDGGFISACACDNAYQDILGNYELPYTNSKNTDGTEWENRTWKIGTNQGLRTRNITLVANASTDNILNYDLPAGTKDLYNLQANSTTVDGCTIPADFGYATATIELPPAEGGSFYLINSIVIDQDNGGQLNLVDQGYVANDDDVLQTTNGVISTLTSIVAKPNYTFGLSFSSHGTGSNFKDGEWNTTTGIDSVTTGTDGFTRWLGTGSIANGNFVPYRCWPQSLISGNSYLTNAGGYISNAVKDGAGVIPNLSFTLTYSKKIKETITRNVKFTMHEFNAQGNYVGPIEVTVTISTVIKDFGDIEAPVMAMYNEGIYDEYLRKISIPASFHQRDLYIEGITWHKDSIETSLAQPTTVYADGNKRLWFVMNTVGGVLDSNNKFGFTFNPNESSSENNSSTLGWYHMAVHDLDIMQLAVDGLRGMAGHSSDDLTWEQRTSYSTMAADPDNPQLGVDATYIGDNTNPKGLWVGTLDGRSTSLIDIGLHFDGNRIYQDQFDIPLAWVTLRMHWYNTKTKGDGTFDIKIKLRTRKEGDTIYLCPTPTLTRTPKVGNSTGSDITLTSYEQQRRENNISADAIYANLENDATSIRDHPDKYLENFKAAMNIYREGDVLDILQTMPITQGDDPVTIIGDDYSTIQIIRYSGSHAVFPSLGCALYGPLIDVRSNGIFTMRNIWINGSGCTRVKKELTTLDASSANRLNDLLFSNSPAMLVRGGANVTFSKRVLISNNFNNIKNTDALYDATYSGDATTMYFCGGAIALLHSEEGKTAQIVLGDQSNIFDNVVLDWNACTSGGTANKQPLNYGAGIYVDGGKLILGGGAEGITVNVKRNYYLKSTDTEDNLGIVEKEMKAQDNNPDHDSKFNVFVIDTTGVHAEFFSLSNVYLARTANSCPDQVRRDQKTDVIYFLSKLSDNSSVGVSKWFPGYLYNETGHRFYNTIPRDTIAIARAANANATLTQDLYEANIFFNDSAYFSKTTGGTSFVLDSSAGIATNAVTYSGDGDNPNYNDRVFIFSNSMVNPYNIYFQRCASFRKGIRVEVDPAQCLADNHITLNKFVQGDSISYHINSAGICMASTDTVLFHVGGGFFPYTYTWYNTTTGTPSKIRSRQTVGSNIISNLANNDYAGLRREAMYDTLVLRDLQVPISGATQNDYSYRVEAIDMTGNCPLVQDVNIRVVKNSSNSEYTDVNNYLMHGTDYVTTAPGVDSSGFHDRSTIAGRNTSPSTMTPTYLRLYRTFTISPTLVPETARLTGTNIPESGVLVYAPNAASSTDTLHWNTEYCPGDVVTLVTNPKRDGSGNPQYDFVAWSHDPTADDTTIFVVSSIEEENSPVAYYAPLDYWWQAVTSFDHTSSANNANPSIATKYDYDMDYYGNVTIKTEKGLAWLISAVNGYNGQSGNSFVNNVITLAPGVTFDMAAHKWTPLGNQNNPFRGTFKSTYDGDVQYADAAIPVVKNLIVNESNIPLVGMFGFTDQAEISGFHIESAMMKGNNYVGTLAGKLTHNTSLTNVGIKSATLFGVYVVGSVVGRIENNSIIDGAYVGNVNLVGNTIYASGVAGLQDNNTTIQNFGPSTFSEAPNGGKDAKLRSNYQAAINIRHLNTIYWGGISNVDVQNNKGRRSRKSGEDGIIRNSFVSVIAGDGVQKGGGLVGRAENITIENSYAHGSVKGSQYLGGLVGYMGNNVSISNCYYLEGMSDDLIGYNMSGTPATKSTTFHGSGHNVVLRERVDGYNNMIRALNAWVRSHGEDVYRSWVPDLSGGNDGYPVFGDQIMIQVSDTLATTSCGEFDFDGITYYESGAYIFHVVDEDDYLDSTFTLILTVNYGDTTQISDSISLGDGYSGYGFNLSADDINNALGFVRHSDIMVLRFVDSLYTVNGCDSVVTLTLYVATNGVATPEVVQQLNDVKVYPNPTRGIVNVEGSDLEHIEVYDNVSRRVLDRSVSGDHTTFDLSGQPTGNYYIRVRTAHGTVVKKLVKK